MFTPLLRMFQAALSHQTLGIAAQLNLMEPDLDDTLPAAPFIINPVDHSAAAQGPPVDPESSAFDDWPVLVATIETEADIQITGVLGKPFDAPDVPVSLVYLTGDIDPDQSWRDADYTFRAAAHALNAALFASNMAIARIRGKVRIEKYNRMTYGPAFNVLTKGKVAGIMRVYVHVRIYP